MPTFDMSTPCGRAAYWQDVFQQLASGKTVASASFNSGNGTSQTVTYSRGDMQTVLLQLRHEQSACDKANGLAPQRHAIGSGYRPRPRNNGPFFT